MPHSEQQWPWYKLPLAFLLAPLGCLLSLLAIPLYLPFVFAIVGLQAVEERLFRRRMARAGRFVPWEELRPALEAGSGTLIIEQLNKHPIRIWWTPDDVLSLAPCPPPAEDDLDLLGIHAKAPHPFVSWCHRRYTDEETGEALITQPSPELPPGLILGPFFREQFPRISAIDTVYCSGGGETRVPS